MGGFSEHLKGDIGKQRGQEETGGEMERYRTRTAPWLPACYSGEYTAFSAVSGLGVLEESRGSAEGVGRHGSKLLQGKESKPKERNSRGKTQEAGVIGWVGNRGVGRRRTAPMTGQTNSDGPQTSAVRKKGKRASRNMLIWGKW